jgi:hypothetical protein
MPIKSAVRGSAYEAALIIGVSIRTVQDMAQNGELPGAVKVRRRWTFDLEKLREKMRRDERQQAEWRSEQKHRPVVSGAAVRSGAALGLRASSSAGRSILIIQQLQKNAAKRAKTS